MPSVLTAESVSKCFRIHRDRPTTFKESIVRYLTGHRYTHEPLWALQNVSFSVEQGRALGMIGHNGAGKSTLLRLLCGVGRPTGGRITHNGHVSGLLELGSGFHLDMTGRENIMTAGILNGLTRRQVLAQRDEIIAFAELEDFVDQPVRTYSSGMYLRLAFSTAIHFDPDVLLIDEVLAVGDSRFRRKCIDRLNDFKKAGKTLVLVSHDMDQISSLCDEVLVLEEGRIVTQCDPKNAIQCYHDLMQQRTEKRAAQLGGVTAQPGPVAGQGTRLGTQEATILAVHLYNDQGKATDSIFSGESITIELEYGLVEHVFDMALSLGIYSETNVKCFEASISSIRTAFGSLSKQGRIRCRLPEVPLIPGRYYINLGLYPTNWDYIYDYHWQTHTLHMIGREGILSGTSGVVLIRPVWSVEDGPLGNLE